MKPTFNKILLGLFVMLIWSCGSEEKKEEEPTEVKVESRIPQWAKSANIYEVNIRQYTPEGTLEAFREHLPRLHEMGVDILWFMPIQPIGLKNRKHSEDDFGSYYSIADYTEVNPDLGTLEEFKEIVYEAQKLGMYVVLDWVANHTAWDHKWVEAHPEWYTADSSGNRPIVPIDNEGGATDWTDVADLNYDNKEMRAAMVEDMKFWLRETNIDGFRCDVAGFVPFDFWDDAITQLRGEREDIFMLAEWEDPKHMKSFHMNYGWHMHHLMNQVAKGDTNVSAFINYTEILNNDYGPDDIRMYFTTNHDENSWNGTIKERMGEAGNVYFVLASTFDKGMPLIYSGQEMGLDHRLSFFGKDTIKWEHPEIVEFYKRCLALKHKNSALWNGNYGAPMQLMDVDNDQVLIYFRENEKNRVVVFLNFSDQLQQAPYRSDAEWRGKMENWFDEGSVELIESSGEINLEPYEYKVFVQDLEQPEA